jgi:flavin-binding protein dodecin
MSVVKVIELIAEGDSLEGAIESGVRVASKSVRNIKAVNVENIQGLVEQNQVVRYRVDLKVSFVVED